MIKFIIVLAHLYISIFREKELPELLILVGVLKKKMRFQLKPLK